jgi:hypothetical protein
MNKPEGCCRYNRQGKHLDPDEIKVHQRELHYSEGKANVVAQLMTKKTF